MNCAAIILLTYLAIDSGSSSTALSGNGKSISRKSYTTEELGTCPMNSSISLKVFRNLRGEWLTTFVDGNKLRNFTRSMDLNLEKNVLECGDSRYITISGFLKDTDADNSSEAAVSDYRNNTDGEACDSCKGIKELATTAEDNANQTRKAMQIVEQRMNDFDKTLINFEKTQYNINETLINFVKTQAIFQKTLTNIEQILNEMRVISNYTKNLETEGKENATTKPSPFNPVSSVTKVKENITTCPHFPVINKLMAKVIFDRLYKGRNAQLSSDLRTATRTRPTESDGFAGVVSNSLLKEDEVFQIRIDETIDQWSEYGIAIGVIKEKKEDIGDKRGIFHHVKGTWAIRSSSGYEFGKSDTWKDANKVTENGYPLQTDRLPVGTLLGVSRRTNGNLHFYLNGVDKGAAFVNVTKDVYAFVDVIEYVKKISILT